MTDPACGICGGRKRRMSAVRRQVAYIAALALSFLRGDTVRQMSRICVAVLELHFGLCDALQRMNSMVRLASFNCYCRYRGF